MDKQAWDIDGTLKGGDKVTGRTNPHYRGCPVCPVCPTVR